MHRFLLALTTIIALFGSTDTVRAADGDPATTALSGEEAASVPAAVAAIRMRLERQGFDVVAVIDHQANAASVGLTLPPTQVVLFRRPQADAFLVRRSQSFALDLPQKILVWETESGDIRLLSEAASVLAQRHGARHLDPLLQSFERAQSQFSDAGLVTVRSQQSLADTVVSLRDALTGAGFRVPLQIDFQEGVSGRVARQLRPTVLVVAGNPNVGTLLMQNSRQIALNLPQKFLIWEDRHGGVNITYNDPQYLAARGGIDGLGTLLGNVSRALANFANAAAGN